MSYFDNPVTKLHVSLLVEKVDEEDIIEGVITLEEIDKGLNNESKDKDYLYFSTTEADTIELENNDRIRYMVYYNMRGNLIFSLTELAAYKFINDEQVNRFIDSIKSILDIYNEGIGETKPIESEREPVLNTLIESINKLLASLVN